MNEVKEVNNKPLVVYHAGCPDGFGAAFAFWKVFGDNCEYVPGSYGKPLGIDVTDREVYLVDFSFKREVVVDMVFVAKKVVYIDHHISSMQDLESVEGLEQYTSLEMSGAVLAWKYLQENFFLEAGVPEILEHIQDMDLWKFQKDGTQEVIAGLMSYTMDFKIWDGFTELGGANFLRRDGYPILRKMYRDIGQAIVATLRFMIIGGFRVKVANVPHMWASDTCAIMYGDGEQYFVATYYDDHQYRCFSLRSKKGQGIDVAIIAAQYGGGGHKHAAGFKVPREHALAQL